MDILLTNDDGFKSEGLLFLASALKNAGHRVFTVTPTGNRSAVSRALTTRGDMALVKISEDFYALCGTPVDCVLVAVHRLGFAPSIVLSGINYGGNLGSDVYYSGTVAAAAEGANEGFPAIALSQDLNRGTPREQKHGLLRTAAEMTVSHLAEWAEMARETEVLNVNFPACAPKGVKICPLSRTRYPSTYSECEGRLRMDSAAPSYVGDGDMVYVKEGFVTVSPIRMMGTDGDALSKYGGGHA